MKKLQQNVLTFSMTLGNVVIKIVSISKTLYTVFSQSSIAIPNDTMYTLKYFFKFWYFFTFCKRVLNLHILLYIKKFV